MLISLHRPLPDNIGSVSQWFGQNPDKYLRYGLAAHNGVDYGVPAMTQVLAMHAGKVRIDAYDPSGYGICLRVINENYLTLYAHLSKILVEDGQTVASQQVLALSGNSGNSTGPHLHAGFKVLGMKNQAYRDWIDFVPFRDI